MNYIVSVTFNKRNVDVAKALKTHNCVYNVYIEETGKITQASIKRLLHAYSFDKANCAFTVTQDDNYIQLQLPAGTTGTLPHFVAETQEVLNNMRMVVLYKEFAPGGVVYVLYDTYSAKVVEMSESDLIKYVQTYKTDARISAAIVSHTQNGTPYIRAVTGKFLLREGKTVQETYDIQQGTLCGLLFAPTRCTHILELPNNVKRIGCDTSTGTFKKLLQMKRTLKIQNIPDNLAKLLCYSNINDVQTADSAKPIDWDFKGNSLYDMRTVEPVCTYCLQSQSANSLVLTYPKQGTVRIGANVLCKTHIYDTVILKNISAVARDAFCENTINTLCIQEQMPVFETGALRKLSVQNVQLKGEYSTEDLARLLSIDTWWGLDELDDVKTPPVYKTVKFYCDKGTKTAELLLSNLGNERVIVTANNTGR